MNDRSRRRSRRHGEPLYGGIITSRSAGRVRLRSFASWPIAVRVVLSTIALALLSILVVGTFLSNAISGSLTENRIQGSVAQTKYARDLLVEELSSHKGETPQELQQALLNYTEIRSVGDGTVFKGLSVFPVGQNEHGLDAVTSNTALTWWRSSAFATSLNSSGSDVKYQMVEFLDSGKSERALLTGARVHVDGVGDFNLFMVFSAEQDKRLLQDVNVILLISGVALSLLFLLVSFVVSRIVTVPLRRTARAAESLSQNNLDVRLAIEGGDDLSRVGTSFNNMAASLQSTIAELVELSEVQRRFVSDVSHELRTPLTTITLATSVLKSESGTMSESGERSLSLLSEQVTRFQGLLADLLEISRHDAGGAELSLREDSLAHLVDSTVGGLIPIAHEHNVQLRVIHHSFDTTGAMDSRRIERIIRNLLTNAIEHGAGGDVLVETARRGTTLCLTVQDFGIGLTPEEAARVFDRFWRADSSRVRTLGGTGLGLAISREDTELHGGRLEVWGEKGRTTVFRLTIPQQQGAPLGAAPLTLERPLES